ncbi:hypothetical protein A2955_04195 [Candidatus Woesebacteria bacterium RIFCSPLOWO2_01_FULL_37_19]|uniref:Uncharacterized protein n=2 Tax=Candidatus Woeseibacteriota TaxID=1752722 RepID=A0A1F8B0R4_9BACT|nr:MAG: hypothetical protein A2771_01220 [Candidatus Woesebacteria bacterium RIFCSPHIGHO2_01_FULL_38_26b]OGM57520.1 MAG: hypothetical protein A2955_04195 [Candidatus Woesebacteria bacterium RIFCSPLOWO2_01_FULL_37_19]
MSKRKKFILTSIVTSLGFLGIQLLPESFRILSIAALGLLTTLLFIWSLWEGLGLNLTLLTLVLPFYFTVGVGLFWFLLPVSIITRVPILVLFGFGIYALCLTANIYTVAAIRTIALMRAARGVGFVLTLLTFFLIFDTLLSLHWPVYYSSFLVMLTSFPLYYQGYWSIVINKTFTKDVFLVSAVSSLMIGEIAASLFFWPVTVVVGSLFLTLTAYVLLGLGQAKIEGRLFSQTIKEYLILGFFVFIGMFIATSWSR